MTGPHLAFDPPAWATLSKPDRALLLATAAFLFFASASGSAGLRGAMLAIGTFAIVWSRRGALIRDLLQAPRFLLVMIVLWALLALASVSWSAQPRFSLAEVRAEAGYGTLAFVLFFAAAFHLGRWKAWWLALIAGTLLVFALHITQDWFGVRLSRHPMDGGPGPWSTHLVLIAPLLLVIVWPRPWGLDQRTPVKLVALLLLLVAAADTANRIVWAALAAELVMLAMIASAMPAMEATRVASLRRVSLLVAIALALGFAASVLERNARHYRSDPSVTASIDRDLRPRLWTVAWMEFRKAPLLGHGFGREILQAKFMPVTPRPDHPPMRHSHNVFADVALQVGVLGLAIFVAILVALGREYRGYLRDERLAPLGIMGLAILVGFVVKNLTDDFFYRHNALVFWALNGMMLGLGGAVRTRARH